MSASLDFLQPKALWLEVLRCSPWIQAALDKTAESHHLLDVQREIMFGRARLWSTDNGCVVTVITQFPASKMCQLWLCGGNFMEVLTTHYDVLESWAKAEGCDRMFINGRKGWQRKLAREGHDYKLASVVLTKELDQ